jgi:hypothetical protein
LKHTRGEVRRVTAIGGEAHATREVVDGVEVGQGSTGWTACR